MEVICSCLVLELPLVCLSLAVYFMLMQVRPEFTTLLLVSECRTNLTALLAN